MNRISDGPTTRELCTAICKVAGTLLLLGLELSLVFWLVSEFGAQAGLTIFFASLIGLTVITIATMLAWYRYHPTASVRAP